MHWDLTSNSVLTMEYCEGGKINDFDYMKKRNINCSEVGLFKHFTNVISTQYHMLLGHMEVRQTIQ